MSKRKKTDRWIGGFTEANPEALKNATVEPFEHYSSAGVGSRQTDDGTWIEITNPETGKKRKVFIPNLESLCCPNCGRAW